MVDAAFRNAGKTKGLEIWRIENKAPVKLDRSSYGKFHVGDSYICLSTTLRGSSLVWALHFWLGNETSQDEAGICAYKTVELDESLGGGPVQCREVQGNESNAFIALFKDTGGVEYLPGGVASGFRHVEPGTYPKRLLHVKGKRVVRVTEVPLSNASLNTGDVFILDLGLEIFIYNGASANRNEKAKGIEVASRIRNDERGGKASITVLDEDPRNNTFWTALGGFLNVTNGGEDDGAVVATPPRLLRVSDNSGSVSVDAVDTGDRLTKAALSSDDVFIVDTGSKVFVWVGKGASPAEKRESMLRATAYVQQQGYARDTPIERVAENAESAAFKSNFALWDAPKPPTFGSSSSGVAKTGQDQAIDVSALLSRPSVEEQTIDDGNGKLEIWRVEDFKLVAVDPSSYGQFYGGDSYVLLYTYLKNKIEEYVIYFWQGAQSSQDEKGASALLAKDLDDSKGGRPVQVRVVQGKEPAHFRQLFRGSMVVYAGGKASGFKNRNDSDSQDVDGTALFHVRGTTASNTVGVQVPEVASNLNSADCFVLVTPSNAFVWKGNGATDVEQIVALNIGNILAGSFLGRGGRTVEAVNEGGESDSFWASLGGKTEYATVRAGEPAPRDPRLFQCSTATGTFRVEEVASFDQSDLIDDDVMLLDCYTSVFVWVGSQSSSVEKTKALEVAAQFVQNANDGRDADCPIIRVSAGAENVMFTSQFVGWDSSLAEKNKYVDPYQAKLDALAKEKAAKSGVQEETKSAAPAAAPVKAPAAVGGFFSYETLKSGIPDGVDPANKETYLSDAEFLTVIGVSKADFAKQPGWKKQAKKKEVGLF